MKLLREPMLYVGVAGAALVGYMLYRNGVRGAASGAVGAIGQAAVGAVEGIGSLVGIPRTNLTECERAKAEGRWLDASFSCPAANFIGSGAYAAGNTIQEAIVPGPDSLGTWLYGVFHPEPEPTTSKPASWAASKPDPEGSWISNALSYFSSGIDTSAKPKPASTPTTLSFPNPAAYMQQQAQQRGFF